MTMTNHATTTSSVPNREYCQGIHVGFEKLLFLRFAKFDFVYLLKTAQQSRNKGSSGCATPKENINRISPIVDEEHFLVFFWQYSLFGTQATIAGPEEREKKEHRLFAYYILQKWTLNGWLMMTNALQLVSKALRLWLVLRGETSSFWQLLLMMMIVW